MSLALLFALGSLRTPARADDLTSNHRDTFGEVGLLEMPSARMAPDGELAFSMAGINAGQRFALSFQLLPWLETSFRYSRLPRVSGNGRPEFDRSFGLKIRLFQETEYTPDISLGIRDILGTGIYSAEYLAATKRIADFDVTAGLGWGRLAESGTFSNPFGLISKSFKTRKPFSGQGGTVNFGQFFHGPDAGLFGGITWHTPIENLDLIAEYSSDRYTLESSVGSIQVRSPVNLKGRVLARSNNTKTRSCPRELALPRLPLGHPSCTEILISSILHFARVFFIHTVGNAVATDLSDECRID